METEGRLRLADVFVSIHVPRQKGKVDRGLVELLMAAVNAVRVGADTFVEIELWAKENIAARFPVWGVQSRLLLFRAEELVCLPSRLRVLSVTSRDVQASKG